MTDTAEQPDADLDPRVERSRRVIQDAAIAEMAAVGYGAMTVEAVAKRAGVSKATIYRQWKNKLGIVESALGAKPTDIVFDESVPARDRIMQMLTWLATFLADADDPMSACLPALVSASQYHEDVRDFHHRFSAERRSVLTEMIRDGQESGHIDSTLDPVRTTEMLVGPLFYRRLMTAEPFAPDDIPALVNSILR